MNFVFFTKDFEYSNEFYRAGSGSKDAAKWLKVCSKGKATKLFSIDNMVNCKQLVGHFMCGEVWVGRIAWKDDGLFGLCMVVLN